MKIFIAGVMQGTRLGLGISSQSYRQEIADILRTHVLDVEILDPNEYHPNGMSYNREKAKRTFIEMADLAAEADCLVAYVPEASMGTAVEMYRAYQAGVPVYTISPLKENWAVFTLSSELFPDIRAFDVFVAGGGLTGA